MTEVEGERAELVRLATSQSGKVQALACVSACERAFPLINRLACCKSRLVSRYAIEELWAGVSWGWSGRSFLKMVATLPEVAAWDPHDPAYYAMSGISIVAHTYAFLDGPSTKNVAYVMGSLFDLATEWDAGGEREIDCQHRVYQLTVGQPDPDAETRQLLRMGSLRAAFDYAQSVDRFCTRRGW